MLGAALWLAFLTLDLAVVDSTAGRVITVLARGIPAGCLVLVGFAQRRRAPWLSGRVGRNLVFGIAALLLGSYVAIVAARTHGYAQTDVVAVFVGTLVLIFVKVPLWWRATLVGAFYGAFVVVAQIKAAPGLDPVPLGLHLFGAGVAALAGAAHLDRRFDVSYSMWHSGREREASMARAMAENEALRRRLEHQASIDPLTNVLNRRAFFARASAHLDVALAANTVASVIVVDADRFKQINDTFGHATGDDVLKQLARRLGDVLRDHDIVGRLGGEEFAVFLPGEGGDRGGEVGERLRDAISRRPFDALADGTPLTISVGVAESVEGEPLPALLCRADEAMYVAKRAGGDRVSVAPPGTATPVLDAS